MNMIDQLLQVVQANPAAPAMIHARRLLTRVQFLQLVMVVARRLHERGIAQGEVVGVSMDHSPLHLATMLALARLGAVSLPVHPSTPPVGQLRLMQQFQARRLLTMPGAVAKPLDGVECFDLGEIDLAKEAACDPHFIDYWPAADTPARIGLTSGTTGAPGAILYSHEFWLHRIATTVDNCDEHTRLMPSNLHLTLGNLSAFAALFVGGVLVFHRLHDLESFYRTLSIFGVTHALMPPSLIPQMAALNREEGPAFPALRHLRIVGGGLTPRLIDLARRKLSPQVYLPYGLSEVGAVSMATPELLSAHPEFAGRCKPGVRVEARDANGQALPVGSQGELWVSVPGQPMGYHNNPERTAARFCDGWFKTGDIGLVTADGLVRIEGRADDRINLGGQKFQPERVESVLQQHPEVKEIAVFTVNDQQGDKVLVAAAVLNHGGQVQKKFTEFCREQRLGGLMPRRFFVVKELPRNPAGKLVRAELPRLLARKGNAMSGEALH